MSLLLPSTLFYDTLSLANHSEHLWTANNIRLALAPPPSCTYFNINIKERAGNLSFITRSEISLPFPRGTGKGGGEEKELRQLTVIRYLNMKVSTGMFLKIENKIMEKMLYLIFCLWEIHFI